MGRLRRDDRQGYRAVSGVLFCDRAIRGLFHPRIWLRVSRRRKEKGRLRRDDRQVIISRSGVRFIQAFGYGYRAVAGKRGAYVAMIGRVIAR